MRFAAPEQAFVATGHAALAGPIRRTSSMREVETGRAHIHHMLTVVQGIQTVALHRLPTPLSCAAPCLDPGRPLQSLPVEGWGRASIMLALIRGTGGRMMHGAWVIALRSFGAMS